jgi:hypothetical protein
MQRKKEWFEPPTEAEQIIANQFKKQKVKKKRRYGNNFESYPIRTKKKCNQEENTNHSINQYILSEDSVNHSDHTAQPIEVSSTEVMSSIRRGETILMAWLCFISSNRNTQFLFSTSNKPSKQTTLKQLFRSGIMFSEKEKEYTRKEETFKIFWKKLFIKWKSLIREILFGGGKRGHQPYDWETWISDLVEEVFVVGKPDNRENLSTGGERSNLENIGTIFIVLHY